MKHPKILALFGESGAGKDSIQQWLCRSMPNEMHGLVSYTTRPPRDYEENGRDYNFISKEDFEKMISRNLMLEYTTFKNWYYGTSITALRQDKINVGVFNPAGIDSLLKFSDNIEVLPVWIQASAETRLWRALMREKHPDCYEICRRFLADVDDFALVDFDYEVFLNDKNGATDYYGFLNRPKIAAFLKGETN